jgi:8-oxo-dGTP diphosphatase
MIDGYHIAGNVLVLCDDKVLLVKRGCEPDRGRWAFPGGHIELGEDIEAGAFRELAEETGLSIRPESKRMGVIFERYNQHVVFYFVVQLYLTEDQLPIVRGQDDAEEARWTSLGEAQGMELAFDHNKILGMALNGEYWAA